MNAIMFVVSLYFLIKDEVIAICELFFILESGNFVN
jgi:hypothetical protein